MPAHNESGYLETAVADVDEGLRTRGLEHEILVVENGSTDDTLAIGRRLADALPSVRVSTRPVADYGAALRDGILAARGELIVTFDVDYYDLGFVDDALKQLTGDAPTPAIVVGSKRGPGALDDRPWPRRRVTTPFGLFLPPVFQLAGTDLPALRR